MTRVSSILKQLGPFVFSLVAGCLAASHAEQVTFNVRDYGASGIRGENAQAAIQKAIDACTHAGGGTVEFPAGDYTSGGIKLRSHVRVYLEPGATIWASEDAHAYAETDPSHGGALFYGQDLENVTLEGRGIIDGQAKYHVQWNNLNDPNIRSQMLLAKSLGKPLLMPFPLHTYPRLILLIRCKNVRIAGISLLHCGNYNLVPYQCEHVVIDGIVIHDSIHEGVWSDGIDPNGSRDVHISNSTIETGDDAIVFWSNDMWGGRALPCENITVTNCRLSSASSALKFCDVNQIAVRHVTVSNCVITNSNRGIAFMVWDGGYVSDVVISNITIECNRKEWYWWGNGDPIHFNLKQRSQIDGIKRPNEPPPGSIRNVIIQNVIAHGPGTSLMSGVPKSLLQNITFDNVKIFVSADPSSPYENTSDAMKIEWVKGLTLRNFQIVWDSPRSQKWTSAIHMDHVQDVDLDNIGVRQAPTSPQSAAVVLDHADGILIRNSRAVEGTAAFIEIRDAESRNIEFFSDDLRAAQAPYRTAGGASAAAVKLFYTLTPSLKQ